ncbi:hypothetical protein AK812_SmicGene44397 [Symbiodinium microadriaticum]|uniref:Uncharacterized protein n=1 Tax=Symbiodinium microadriaticum TaxID=2951 RepID=A0A1Q9BYK3_SYMMI|nr:hypothetical protein AK812_SmicGene44397 [Symbiodinium microadriaticum]
MQNWRFSGLLLCDEGELQAGVRTLRVDEEFAFSTELEMFLKHVDFNDRWTVSCHEIISPLVDLPSEAMVPDRVLIKAMPGEGFVALDLWQGAIAERAHRQRVLEESRQRARANRARDGRPARPHAGGDSGPRGSQRALDDVGDIAEAAEGELELSDEEEIEEDIGDFESLVPDNQNTDDGDAWIRAAWDLMEAEAEINPAAAAARLPAAAGSDRAEGGVPPPPVTGVPRAAASRGFTGRSAASDILVLPDDYGELHYYRVLVRAKGGTGSGALREELDLRKTVNEHAELVKTPSQSLFRRIQTVHLSIPSRVSVGALQKETALKALE